MVRLMLSLEDLKSARPIVGHFAFVCGRQGGCDARERASGIGKPGVKRRITFA